VLHQRFQIFQCVYFLVRFLPLHYLAINCLTCASTFQHRKLFQNISSFQRQLNVYGLESTLLERKYQSGDGTRVPIHLPCIFCMEPKFLKSIGPLCTVWKNCRPEGEHFSPSYRDKKMILLASKARPPWVAIVWKRVGTQKRKVGSSLLLLRALGVFSSSCVVLVLVTILVLATGQRRNSEASELVAAPRSCTGQNNGSQETTTITGRIYQP
jgi:hypothetical protein